jgi:hypothetical protein
MEREHIKGDVVVIGGGPGGIGAAVAAAREGVKVILVERLGYLGGNLGSGQPLLAFLDNNRKQIVAGLAQQLIDGLEQMSGENPDWPDGSAEGTAGHRYCPFHTSVTCINQFYVRILLFEWAKKYNIQLLMHCELTDATVINGKIRSVTVTGKGKAFDLEAEVFIDATGDGDLAYLSGAAFEKGDENGTLQPPTLVFNLSGVDFDRFLDYIEVHPEETVKNTPEGYQHIQAGYDAQFMRNNPGHNFVGLQNLINKHRKENCCPIERDTFIYMRQPIPGTVTINTIRIKDIDGSDIHDLSRAELEGHLQILPLFTWLKKYVPGFEKSYITTINPVIGIRESRRIMGIRKLQKSDTLNGVIPPDAIALFSYFIDIHVGNNDKTLGVLIQKPYGVPYGCTVSKDIDGLMMSGRCISADSFAHGSSRIMTLCIAVGEAAGIGAALSVKNNISPKEVDPQDIRGILLTHGAILES